MEANDFELVSQDSIVIMEEEDHNCGVVIKSTHKDISVGEKVKYSQYSGFVLPEYGFKYRILSPKMIVRIKNSRTLIA